MLTPEMRIKNIEKLLALMIKEEVNDYVAREDITREDEQEYILELKKIIGE